jgi:hypothetical protein
VCQVRKCRIELPRSILEEMFQTTESSSKLDLQLQLAALRYVIWGPQLRAFLTRRPAA